MRKLVPITAILMAFLVALAPVAEANKYKPGKGKRFKLRPKQKAVVVVTGFQGCTFEVLHTNQDGKGATDTDVATVTTSGKLAKAQKVILTAVGPGLTTVNLNTTGESPSCNNFSSSYEVLVEPDFKPLLKELRTCIKQVDIEIAGLVKQQQKDYCAIIKAALTLIKQGSDPDSVLDLVFQAMDDSAYLVDVTIGGLTNALYNDLWDKIEEADYYQMTPDLVSFLDGGCGEWDRFESRVQALARKLDLVVQKKFKGVRKAIDKQQAAGGDALLVAIGNLIAATVQLPPVALPVPGEPAPTTAPDKEVHKNWTASGRLANDATGRLRIGGSADPAAGNVTISIVGPDGDDAEQSVPVGGAESSNPCRWGCEFTDLTPGTYTVTMTQDGESTSFTTVVP